MFIWADTITIISNEEDKYLTFWNQNTFAGKNKNLRVKM